MMKKIYTLLFIAIVSFNSVKAQVIYSNTVPSGFLFNPGLGVNGTPSILMDDVNIDNAVLADGDSIGITQIKVGIARGANAPAVTVTVYLTGADPLWPSFAFLDSFPNVPPTVVGTFNLPANGATAGTQILTVGDGINIVKSLARDTSQLFDGFQTAFVGVSFSNNTPANANGWELTTQSTSLNGNFVWGFDVDDVAEPRSAFRFSAAATPRATFNIEVSGRPVYVPVAFDARAVSVEAPSNVSCLSGPQTVTVQVQNSGTNPIPAGQATVNLKVTGPINYNNSIANAAVIPPNGTATVTFNNVDLSAAGLYRDTVTIAYAADLRNTNNVATTGSLTAATINAFPAIEDVEGALPLIAAAEPIVGDQIWTIQTGKFGNLDPFDVPGSWDGADSLAPHGGDNFFLFDSYSISPAGIESRLFTNCVALGTPPSGGSCATTLSFFMSHDSSFAGLPDSLYVSVSTDKGVTWNRLAGFGRFDASFLVPGWSQEIVDLSAFNGQTIQIGFEGVSSFGNSIGLDDISIESNCVVPVNLVSFNVAKQPKANRLTWKTSSEVNSLKYVIQQSKDGRSFVDLGEVSAAGTSTTETTYSYEHSQPSKGYNYYRIKMVDKDNKSKLSPVRSVLNLGLNEISVAPNPVVNTMRLNINADRADAATVVVSDMSGKIVLSRTYSVAAGDNTIPVNTANLNAGSYIVKVQLNGDVQMSKFIKL